MNGERIPLGEGYSSGAGLVMFVAGYKKTTQSSLINDYIDKK